MKRLVRWHKMNEECTAALQYNNNDGSGWQSYKKHPHFELVREYTDADGSPGFKMFQHLLGQGYQTLDQEGKEI